MLKIDRRVYFEAGDTFLTKGPSFLLQFARITPNIFLTTQVISMSKTPLFFEKKHLIVWVHTGVNQKLPN